MRRAVGRGGKVTLVLVVGVLLAGSALAAYYLTTTGGPTPSVSSSSPAKAPVYSYQVVETYPHDTGAFTEGLTYYNGSLYESTGLNGDSSLRRVDIGTGRVLQAYDLPREYFGEGMTIFNGTIIQLTYQTHIGFVYDLKTFAILRNFTYPDEGWGLTNNGTELIMSDGSANLYFLNPQTFQRTGQVTVRDGTTPIDNLNELEYINGSVFANVWLSNMIAVINPSTGQVTAWINLTGIENLSGCNCDTVNDVLNGIAYDPAGHQLYVTGKDWPSLFEIRVEPTLAQSTMG
jgi:glutamine cyclotransferase